MMPIITCGGMRQQFTWKEQATTSNSDITKECDDNFQAIVDRYSSPRQLFREGLELSFKKLQVRIALDVSFRTENGLFLFVE